MLTAPCGDRPVEWQQRDVFFRTLPNVSACKKDTSARYVAPKVVVLNDSTSPTGSSSQRPEGTWASGGTRVQGSRRSRTGKAGPVNDFRSPERWPERHEVHTEAHRVAARCRDQARTLLAAPVTARHQPHPQGGYGGLLLASGKSGPDSPPREGCRQEVSESAQPTSFS